MGYGILRSQTEKAFQFALPLSRKDRLRFASALARGEVTLRKARALFGLTRRLSGGAR
jgi:hypothetical protein